MLEEDKPNKAGANRQPDGTFGPGNLANPEGRPKGKTLKEFAREFLMKMDDKQKIEFLNSLSKDIVWKMAEGNPHQSVGAEIIGEIPFQIKIIKEEKKENGTTEREDS